MKPFGIRDKIGYMLGDFGNDFFFMLSSSFLMVFYTRVLGINSAIVGTMFLVARCIDGFTDVGMGRLVDMSKPTKDGKFRPWIRRMCIPVVLAGILMFIPAVASLPMNLRIVYIYCTYLLWGSVCYTSINIPYGSMASVITNDPVERAALSTFRSVGASLAGVIINAIVPLVIYITAADGSKVVAENRIIPMVLIFGVCALTSYILCYKMSTERIQVKRDPSQKLDLRVTLKGIVHNRALISIVAAAIILLLSMLISNTLNNYLYLEYFKNSQALSLAGFFGAVCALLLAPFVGKIIARFGKKEAAAVALLFTTGVYLLLFILRLTNPWIFCLFVFVGGFGSGLFNLVIWAFITDVIDYQEIITGSREDGTIYAVYSFARKLGQALAGGLGGWALAFVGYQSSTGGAAVVQSSETLSGIYTMCTLVPAIGYGLIALILIFWYPLDKKQLAENVATLAAKHAAQS